VSDIVKRMERRAILIGMVGGDKDVKSMLEEAAAEIARLREERPDVMLPAEPDCSPMADYGRGWLDCLDAVRASLAAAGVAVKEAT